MSGCLYSAYCLLKVWIHHNLEIRFHRYRSVLTQRGMRTTKFSIWSALLLLWLYFHNCIRLIPILLAVEKAFKCWIRFQHNLTVLNLKVDGRLLSLGYPRVIKLTSSRAAHFRHRNIIIWEGQLLLTQNNWQTASLFLNRLFCSGKSPCFECWHAEETLLSSDWLRYWVDIKRVLNHI